MILMTAIAIMQVLGTLHAHGGSPWIRLCEQELVLTNNKNTKHIIHVYVCIYIYIHREREREIHACISFSLSLYIYMND